MFSSTSVCASRNTTREYCPMAHMVTLKGRHEEEEEEGEDGEEEEYEEDGVNASAACRKAA